VEVELKRPLLADVKCSRIQFQPGDRILVRTYQNLDAEQKRKLRATIVKWAGVEIEVLIYSSTEMEIQVDKSRREIPRIFQG